MHISEGTIDAVLGDELMNCDSLRADVATFLRARTEHYIKFGNDENDSAEQAYQDALHRTWLDDEEQRIQRVRAILRRWRAKHS